MEQEGSASKNYVNILWMLLKMRQACNHPHLVKGAGETAEPVPEAAIAAAKKLPQEKRRLLREVLTSTGAREMCGVCLDLPEDPVVSNCGHIYCQQCIHDRITTAAESYSCASCGVSIAVGAFHCKRALQCADGEGGADAKKSKSKVKGKGAGLDKEAGKLGLSSKINSIIKYLRNMRGMPEHYTPIVPGGAASGAGGGGGKGKPGKGTVAADPGTQAIGNSDRAFASALPPLSAIPQRLDQLATPVASDSLDKAIVFSQWTAMLDVMEGPLRAAGGPLTSHLVPRDTPSRVALGAPPRAASSMPPPSMPSDLVAVRPSLSAMRWRLCHKADAM
ncbi:hypothetical protein CYMTET_34036 [Cymbomonas tetramitiformis]|uniref:RING-type domain-containing protein n=1 Tax=Cymbomonas tetramitiformis TaxID=36881 RepID=A0AAE0FBY0_9CHLO|nr:hypothetical protein CYMTET_34036 [Cymbomonas tetramitiformis]